MKNASTVKKYLLNKNAVLLLISVLTLLFAFMPICQLSYEEEYNDEDYIFDVKFGSLNMIQFFMDGKKELSYDDLEDSALYDKVADLREEVYEELRDLDEDDELASSLIRKIEKLTLYTVRLAMQSDDYTSPGHALVAMIVSGIIMVLAIVFFILCLCNYMQSLANNTTLSRYCTAFLTIIPAVVIGLYFAMLPYADGSGLLASFDIDAETGMSGTAWLLILMPIFYAVGVLVSRIIRHTVHGGKAIPTLVKNGIAAFCAILALVMVFLPVMNTTIKAEFSSDSRKREAKTSLAPQYFTAIDLDEDNEVFEELSRDECQYLFERFERYSKLEVQRGEADAQNVYFLTAVMANAGIEEQYLPLFSIVYDFLLIAGICAALMAAQNLRYLFTGKKSATTVRLCKVFCVLGAALACGMILVYSIVANLAVAEVDLDRYYSVSVAAGPIALLILSIVCACIPAKDPVIEVTPDENEPLSEEEKDAPVIEPASIA